VANRFSMPWFIKQFTVTNCCASSV